MAQLDYSKEEMKHIMYNSRLRHCRTVCPV